MTAGPALAAPTPVRVRIPVPTIAPTPSAIRCGQPRLRWSRCSGAISSSATTALRANRSINALPYLWKLDRQAGEPSLVLPAAKRWRGLGHGLPHHVARRGVAADEEIP